MATVYFARWVLLPDYTVLENGAVAVDGSTITSVGTRGTVKRGRGDRSVNLGQMLLMPGLINLHTHLEEGTLRGLIAPEEPFAHRFAKKATRLRQAEPAAVEQAVRLGVRELLTNGITTVLDSSRLGLSEKALEQEPIRAWIHHEISPEFTVDEEDSAIDGQFEKASQAPLSLGAAVGPHAIFSLSPRNHRRTINQARDRGLLWAAHVAESAEEVQAFSEHSGDLYSQLTRKRPWPFVEAAAGPMYHAITANLIPNGAICFHCNYATGNDLALLAVKQASMVVCPRYTTEYHLKSVPVELALNRNIRVCVGTESAAEADGLSLFDEIFALHAELPHIAAREVLSWVTRNPAAALGMANRLGALSEGFFADMIGVQVPHDPRQNLLEELLTEEPCIGFVMVNGEEVIVDL